MENLQKLFTSVCDQFKEKTSKASFDMWLKDASIVQFENNTFFIKVPTNYEKNWIESHYSSILIELFSKNMGYNCKVSFVLANENRSANISSSTLPNDNINPNEDNYEQGFQLEKYTFDKFVVGNANSLAHAACLAVAANPGKAYNPLFIYGISGIGKTHLLQSIANAVSKNNPSNKVIYLSSEKFTNEFIRSISENKSDLFRQKYRQVDVLLIDDIQFLSKKIGTQEEFFHTFNTLYEAGKQIVISSDRPPSEIQALEKRLSSRFGWGLITDITPPELETRVAILQKKVISAGIDIKNEILLIIAHHIDTNVRELEGALTRVLAYSSLLNKDISIELAEEALKNIIPTSSNQKTINIFDIQKAVSSFFDMKIEDLSSKSRTKTIAYPRQIAMYLTRELLNSPFQKIGDNFGGRDHSTVLHAYEKIKKEKEKNKQLFNSLENIKKIINS